MGHLMTPGCGCATTGAGAVTCVCRKRTRAARQQLRPRPLSSHQAHSLPVVEHAVRAKRVIARSRHGEIQGLRAHQEQETQNGDAKAIWTGALRHWQLRPPSPHRPRSNRRARRTADGRACCRFFFGDRLPAWALTSRLIGQSPSPAGSPALGTSMWAPRMSAATPGSCNEERTRAGRRSRGAHPALRGRAAREPIANKLTTARMLRPRCSVRTTATKTDAARNMSSTVSSDETPSIAACRRVDTLGGQSEGRALPELWRARVSFYARFGWLVVWTDSVESRRRAL